MTSTMPTNFEYEYNILNAALLDLKEDQRKLILEGKHFAVAKISRVIYLVEKEVEHLKKLAFQDGFIPPFEMQDSPQSLHDAP